MPNSNRKRLANLTHRLIQSCEMPEMHPGLSRELCAFFADTTGFAPPSPAPVDTSGTQLETGLALSPADAGLCILDATRTVRFITGVYRTVHRLIREIGRIHVIYVGTGPFAPLAIPILSCFPLGQVQFTLIDIHEEALEPVQHLIRKLGLGKGIRGCYCTDATQYRHPPGSPVHLAIAETMQNALNREPQVAIMRNLSQQLRPGTRFVPKRVKIQAALVDRQAHSAEKIQGAVFSLTPHTFYPPNKCINRISAGSIRIPKAYRTNQSLQLLTSIRQKS